MNNLKKSLISASIISALALSVQVQAANSNYDIDFRTITDVSILPVTAMDFGGDLRLNIGATCTLNVGAGTNDTPGEVAAKLSNVATTAIAEGSNYGLISGNCDTTTPGTVGVYQVTGAPGVPVKLTANSLSTGTAFDFTPSAIVSDYDGALDGDAFIAVPADTETTFETADASDSVAGGNGVTPLIGKALLFVGGTINVKSVLTAGTTYTEQFTVDLNY